MNKWCCATLLWPTSLRNTLLFTPLGRLNLTHEHTQGNVHVSADGTQAHSYVTLWLWSLKSSCFLKSFCAVSYRQFPFTLVLSLLFPSLCPSESLPPLSLIVFSRVSVSNCSGLQRDGGMERKREGVYESTYTSTRETEQEWGEAERSRTERMYRCARMGLCTLEGIYGWMRVERDCV